MAAEVFDGSGSRHSGAGKGNDGYENWKSRV